MSSGKGSSAGNYKQQARLKQLKVANDRYIKNNKKCYW